MKRLLLTLLCAAALFGQDAVSRVVQLKYIQPQNTAAVLDILAAGRVRWKIDGDLRIVAMSGPAELVDAMEAAVKKLDVPTQPGRNIEVTFHMILASPQGEAVAVPPELAGVAQQLRNVFALKAVRVLETAVLRGREGNGGETYGIMAPPVKIDAHARYFLKYSKIQVSSGDKGANIRIDNLRFNATLPMMTAAGSFQNTEASIITDVDIREGQKVVVGKSSIDTASQSIFLVVTAKVVD